MLVLQRSDGIPLRDARPATLIALLLGSALAFGAFGEAEIHRLASVGLLVLFVAVLWTSLKGSSAGETVVASTSADDANPDGRVDLAEFVVGEGSAEAPAPIWRSALLAISGSALLAVASKGFLIGALSLAEILGWGTGFAGFLIAAAGTLGTRTVHERASNAQGPRWRSIRQCPGFQRLQPTFSGRDHRCARASPDRPDRDPAAAVGQLGSLCGFGFAHAHPSQRGPADQDRGGRRSPP